MADDRWRDDERRRWDEERFRSGGQSSSQGMRGQGSQNQSYNQGHGPGGYPQGGQGYEQGGRNFERSHGQGGQGMSGYPYGEGGHAYAPGSQIWDQDRNYAQEQEYRERPRRYDQSPGEGGNAPRRYGQRGYDSQTGYDQGSYGQYGFGQFGGSEPYGEPRGGGGPQEYERNREYGYGGEMWRGGQQGRRNQPSWNEREYWRGRGDEGGGGPERSWWNRASDEVASWVGDEDAERRRRIDAMRGHSGRGPRGYTRSDERIREDVNDQLTYDSRVDASEIDVNVHNGEVTLSGTVRTRDERRRAEDIAENISGVKHVQNNVRIQQQGQPQGMSSSSSMGASSGSTGSSSGLTGTSGSTGGTTSSSGSTSANRTSTNTAS